MRLFLAAEIPPGKRLSLREALAPLRHRLPDARWTAPESWHVTLKFLGEVSEPAVDEVQEVLEDVGKGASCFPTALGQPGVFPGFRRPRVLWMGLSDEARGFRNLAGRMDRKFEKAGYEPEGRSFRPHLTLARFKDSGRSSVRGEQAGGDGTVKDFLDQLSAQEIDRSPFEITEVVLFQSHLRPGGSVYEPRLRVRLG